MTDLFGNAVAKARYKALGIVVEATLHDERDALTTGIEGWSISRDKYDSNGLHSETEVFDEANRPTLHKAGWHRLSQVRDSGGRAVSMQYWGVKGEPAAIGAENRISGRQGDSPRVSQCRSQTGCAQRVWLRRNTI